MALETFTIIAVGILLFGLFSKRLEKTILTPPMAFTMLGLLLAFLGLMQFERDTKALEILVELTLVLVLLHVS